MAQIANRHMFHGAALTRIAEHEEFTSINRMPLEHSEHRSAFSVIGKNGKIGIFLKYATSADGEYKFSFSWENLEDVRELNGSHDKTYMLLVCLEGKARGNVRLQSGEICCVPYAMLSELKGNRDRRNKELRRREEDRVDLYVVIKRGQPFEVNVKAPEQQTYAWRRNVPRSYFPNRIFD